MFEVVPTTNSLEPIVDTRHPVFDEVYVNDKKYVQLPAAFMIFVNEWEDYGTFGYGNASGQPLRTGEYYSWDDEGEYPVDVSLGEHLAATIEDEKLRKRVCKQVLRWIWDNSVETFALEE